MIDKCREYSIAVLGGGASGIVAAISAKRAGASVVICERLPQPGKKILASGNGRCNLLNEDLSENFYNPSARPLVKSIFSKFGGDDILDFFKGLGLRTYVEGGRIFPVTNQASSVLRVLEIELKRLGIHIEAGFEVAGIADTGAGFVITSRANQRIASRVMIMAAGGMSYPALGSNGSVYKFAGELGHNIVEPVPAAVALVAKDPLCHLLQGQKIFASAKAVIDGKGAGEAMGEVLFTKYGLSGTAVLDISREVSVAINRLGKKSVKVILDMAPFIDEGSLASELERRMKSFPAHEDLIAGILPNKFGPALMNILNGKNAVEIAKKLKGREFIVTGTRGWNEADFTAGGIDIGEVKAGSLESKIKRGLYFAGEILDVDGCRGGYNLAWAWGSGHVAGASAAEACK